MLDTLNAALKQHGPVVSGRRLHQRAGDARRHGRQQLVRLALHRLRQHGAQRARHRRLAWPTAARSTFGPVGERVRARRGDRRLRARPCRAASRRDRRALAEGAAPGRRLQPRHLRNPERAARTPTTAASTSRTCWSAAKARSPDRAALTLQAGAAAGARRCSASSTSRPSTQAMDAAQHIVTLGPTAVELVDRTMIDLALANPAFAPTMRSAR